MSGIDGTRTISIPSMSYNYVDNRLESIGTCGELYYRERGAYAPYAGTRWHELFGTPERAARTIANISGRVNLDRIGGDYDALLGFDGIGSEFDALLEWLRGEA